VAFWVLKSEATVEFENSSIHGFFKKKRQVIF
jgi:hypothetical protein